MATAHTLRPWRSDGCDVYGPYRGPEQLLATAYREERGRNTVDDGREAEANARLIAAAPDLAEAAMYALGKLEALCRSGATRSGTAEELLRAALMASGVLE